MNLKRIARNGLIILAVVVALCMFFARTIVTITTPKVSLAQPQTGKLEQRINLEAKLYFPNSQPVTYKDASKYSMVVDRVYVRPGRKVNAGDVLFTMDMTDYDSKMEELMVKYDAEIVKLADEDIKSRKARNHTNEQNDRYENMLKLQSELGEARTQARAKAIALGIDLPDDIEQWESAAKGDAELLKAVKQAISKQAAAAEAEELFFDSYNDSKVRVSSNLFEYMQKRDAILKEIEKVEADMTELAAAKERFSQIRAERDGYIVEIDVKEGEAYDGKKKAYSLDDPESPPVLRADISSINRKIDNGSKVTVKGDRMEWSSTVDGSGIDIDGKKYVDISLEAEELQYYGGMEYIIAQSESSSYTAYVTYRSSSSSTLIPASALHTDDGDYIFVLDRNNWGGGFMDSGMKARKMNVTVIDKSDRMVAIAEDLWNTEVIYREDHALEDGDRVMEYIN